MDRSNARAYAVLKPALLLTLVSVAAACSSTGTGLSPLGLPARIKAATNGTGDAILIRTPEGRSVSLDEAVDQLADADVVFLGEQHDNGLGHAVQLALTQALAERRGEIVLSMEMFERDSQPTLDLYLRGALTEAEFKGIARLWPNYDEHYRAAVEFCKGEGHPVVAANVYRPIASRVARQGLGASAGDTWAARTVSAPPSGEYRRRFDEVMGGHGGDVDSKILDNVFAAQCVKDDTMAESIAAALAGSPAGSAQVIHWNGRFHSDYGLGTVERLKSRRPDLNIAVVSMIERRPTGAEPLTEDELNQGHFLIVAER
jgi:uncharacterized iron-regulated protein